MIELAIRKTLSASSGQMTLELAFDIEQGSLVTLFGKSGAGKTSVLRILAGLLSPDQGRIVVHGTTWLDTYKKINLKPQKRKVGFLFQEYALFPNMTVKGNLMFALEKGQDKKIVHELIEIIELGELQDRKPETLSGGQKQRVALARALVQKPDILMLDEPLSALDAEMRFKLQDYILQVHQEYGLTTLLISHDRSEILKMSDKILEIEEGKLIRQGTPSEVLIPKKRFGKINAFGTITHIREKELFWVVGVQIGDDTLEIMVEKQEGSYLKLGDKIVIAAIA